LWLTFFLRGEERSAGQKKNNNRAKKKREEKRTGEVRKQLSRGEERTGNLLCHTGLVGVEKSVLWRGNKALW